ncbi:MAG: hypothetical protein I8H68_05850 [Flavobacteriia bacterium]|nr:hypothetical protein [Flavobacteriia bacterium]
MNKLKEIIKTLKAYTILIVENEFTYIEDSKLILGRFCMLTPINRERLINELATKNLLISESLKVFNEKWQDIANHDMLRFERMGADYPDRYLQEIGHREIIEEPISLLKLQIDEDEENILKSIFLKHGIFEDETVPKYKEILECVQSIPECRLIIKNEQPTSAQWDDFKTEIESSILETHSHFCLSIIDKSLGGGMQEGKVLIKDLIKSHKNDERYNHICCLYTSTAVGGVLINYEDYFIQEISKNSHDCLSDIVAALAQSAYAEVFNSLRVKTIESAEQTLRIVLKNQKNIKHIVDKSLVEGIPAYDAIKYWNELSVQNEFTDREVKDFKFIASLTSFFNNDFLNDHPSSSDISIELKKLNSYELFDYNVNKKHLSIAPGDIWRADNGDYYILVGQLCDMMLRKESNKRNARIGELFKIVFGTSQKTKFDIIVSSGKKSVYVDNFYDDVEEDYKTIRVDITSPNIFLANLKILDLAMYNDKGLCSISINSELEETVRQILPTSRDSYHEILKEEYKKILELDELLLAATLEADPIDFSRLKFYSEDNTISHGLRRICRLKGRYFDSLYNQYLNNKGRIDLNLIDNSAEIGEAKTLYLQYGNESSSKKSISITLYTSRHTSYFSKKELLSLLPDEFQELANYFDDEIKLTDKKIAEFIINDDDDSILAKFRYRISETKLAEITETEFDYRSLFKSHQNRYKDKSFRDNSETAEQKRFSNNKISLQELLSGIIIQDTNEKVIFVNGVLKIEQIEQ